MGKIRSTKTRGVKYIKKLIEITSIPEIRKDNDCFLDKLNIVNENPKITKKRAVSVCSLDLERMIFQGLTATKREDRIAVFLSKKIA